MTRPFIYVISFLALVFSLAGHGPAPAGAADEEAEEVFVAVPGPDGVQRVTVTAGSYFFRPERIVVRKWVPVELTLVRDSVLVPHNFVVDAPDFGIRVDETVEKEPKTIAFTPGKAGTVEFYCDRKLLFFKGHRERGMEGTIEIVD